ncbi:hypothetical protein U1Q18_021777 [Sarracenia purpurea var. burkii]
MTELGKPKKKKKTSVGHVSSDLSPLQFIFFVGAFFTADPRSFFTFIVVATFFFPGDVTDEVFATSRSSGLARYQNHHRRLFLEPPINNQNQHRCLCRIFPTPKSPPLFPACQATLRDFFESISLLSATMTDPQPPCQRVSPSPEKSR